MRNKMTRRNPDQYNWEKMEFDEMLLTKHFTPMNNRTIKGFAIHHMIIPNRDMNTNDALRTCYDVWQSRPASAHYGVDGDFVAQFVWDKDFAWANANTWANNHLISVEHANATLDQPGVDNDYVIDEKTFYNGAKLVAYGHNLYGLRPKMDFALNGVIDFSATIFPHGKFYSTACPGPYMHRHAQRYFDTVMDIYNTVKRGGHVETTAPEPKRSNPQPGKVSEDQIVTEVINGLWSNGQERVKRLSKAGYDPSRIQSMVNIRLHGRPAPSNNLQHVAREVINGRWGNGEERFRRLRESGYDPNAVQNIVNQLLR